MGGRKRLKDSICLKRKGKPLFLHGGPRLTFADLSANTNTLDNVDYREASRPEGAATLCVIIIIILSALLPE